MSAADKALPKALGCQPTGTWAFTGVASPTCAATPSPDVGCVLCGAMVSFVLSLLATAIASRA